MPTWEVQRYRLYQVSGHPNPYIRAAVQLFGTANGLEVVFSSAQPLPASTQTRAYMPFDSYASLVAMLREEGPVFVINPDNTTVFFFSTTDEPVGEDEGP